MGLLLVYYFLSFAIELAIRLVRLVVLEVLSPIPVIMSIDPSQKDRLKNFGTTYISTWLSAFVRILTVYIALVVCTFISNNINTTKILVPKSNLFHAEIFPIFTQATIVPTRTSIDEATNITNNMQLIE